MSNIHRGIKSFHKMSHMLGEATFSLQVFNPANLQVTGPDFTFILMPFEMQHVAGIQLLARLKSASLDSLAMLPS